MSSLEEIREHRRQKQERLEALQSSHVDRRKVLSRKEAITRTDHWRPKRFKSQNQE
jgi:hypothetical protein